MQLHLAKDFLEWHEINHHENPAHPHEIIMVLQAEMLYYKNEDITIRATLRIAEHSNHEKAFEVMTHSYAHVHQGQSQQVEFSNKDVLGEYSTLEEAQQAAAQHFVAHHQVRHHND
jgi:hypothetical protein